MFRREHPDMSGKEVYRSLYQSALEKEAESLRLGAPEKVNSIEGFLKSNRIRPNAILELGCGPGAILQECQRRNLSKRYVGVDYSAEAIEYAQGNLPGIDFIQGDISDPGFSLEGSYDVIVLSHVLEHLENPRQFLEALSRSISFSYLVIEVPLDDLIASRLKNLFRNRMANRPGHRQFFTSRALDRLLMSTGFRIIDKRLFAPVLDLGAIRFRVELTHVSKLKHCIEILTSHYLPKLVSPLWKRIYYAHYAVLCVKDS